MVLPIFSNGREIWGVHPAPNLRLVHLKFLKQLLKVRSKKKKIKEKSRE